MEVETHSLSTFDFNLKPPFSFSTDIGKEDASELYNLESRSSEMPELPRNEAPESDGFGSPAASNHDAESPDSGDRKRDRVNEDSVLVSNGACVSTDSAAKKLESIVSSSAMKVQKVYRSYRTRRMLADSAVVAEELWWQAIDYVRLNHSTISFFNYLKPETVPSRWNRISLNASKVGKGLSKDAKAQKLAFQHWIEAIDPRHRYGHSLHLYYEEWCNTASGQPFFYWLDIGDGKEVDLEECPRSKLRQQSIKYLGPQERENFEYIVAEGKIRHKRTGSLLDTKKGLPKAKWIFVMSTSKKLYAGEKKKGVFHHSSFLAGGATLAAGRLLAEDGTLKAISAYSGHYRPTEDRLDSLLSFLRENGVNLDEVEVNKGNEDYENYGEGKSNRDKSSAELSTNSEHQPEISKEKERDLSQELPKSEVKISYKRTLSGGLQSPKAEVPKTAILERINSKKKMGKSYQLGHQLSLQWTTGAGPRIGCVADYPVQLRMQALEFVNLSPRTLSAPPAWWRRMAAPESPTTISASPKASPEANSCNGD